MAEKQLSNPEYVAEIINLLNKKDLTKQFIEKIVSDYHYSDIFNWKENRNGVGVK